MHLFARDWDHAAWPGDFYPQDLPQEWRLTYYANEFQGVLVPAERWQAADEATLHEWVDDVHESFRFYIELRQSESMQEEQSKAALLGRHFAAWVLPQTERADGGVTPCRLDGLQEGCHALLLDADLLEDVMDQRHLLERLAAESGEDRELLLFLHGKAWPIERLRQLSQLSQLLGLA
jgi:hypothetical protein